MSEAVRHDPKVRRSLHGFSDLAYLKNQDPDKHYCIVSKLDRHAIALYESMGYEFESYRDKGVCPRGIAPDQLKKLIAKHETIETLDGYVMSIPRSVLAEHERDGAARMNHIESLMQPKGGALPKGLMNPLSQVSRENQRYFELERFGAKEGSGLNHGDDSRDSV